MIILIVGDNYIIPHYIVNHYMKIYQIYFV